MIETKNLIPQVYFNKSRDFQLISHIYDIVFNYLKTEIDSIYSLPFSQNSDKTLINQVAYTLGFKPKHKYNREQLIYVCSSFMSILKNKGNIQSIRDTLSVLFRAEGIQIPEGITINDCVIQPDLSLTNYVKYIYLYTLGLKNTTLLEDILDYILPAGVLYRIINDTNIGGIIATEYYSPTDSVTIYKRNNANVVYSNETPIISKTRGTSGTVYVPRLDENIKVDEDEDDITIYPHPQVEEES